MAMTYTVIDDPYGFGNKIGEGLTARQAVEAAFHFQDLSDWEIRQRGDGTWIMDADFIAIGFIDSCQPSEDAVFQALANKRRISNCLIVPDAEAAKKSPDDWLDDAINDATA